MPTKGAERQLVLSFAIKGSTIFAGASAGPVPDTTYIGGALRSTDYGATWVKIDSGFFTGTIFPIAVYSFAVVGDSLFAGTSNGVFMTSNDGTTWTETSNGIDSDAASRNVQAMLLNGSNLFAGTQNGIFFSSDRGANWSRRDSGLYNDVYPHNNVLCMTAEGSVIFASVNDGRIFFSTDTGKSWKYYISNGWSVECLVTMDSTLFAGWVGISASTDTTKSWVHLNSGLTDTVYHNFFYIESVAAVDNYLFAGTLDNGLYASSDQGMSWKAENSGLLYPYVPDVWSIGNIEGYLIIGTSYGVYRRSLSEIITFVRNIHGTVPNDFSLDQNYPNPFNPSTVISYDLSSNSFVTLEIFDLLGKKIRILITGYQNAQHYTIKFDASHFASGIYICKLTVNGNSVVQKMVLEK